MSALLKLLPEQLVRQLRTGRNLVAARSLRFEEEARSTGNIAFDDLLGGGLPRGTLVELQSWSSTGRFALVLEALAATTRRGEPAALVDLGDALDPRLAERIGIDLERLLWLRPQKLKEALQATEILLDGGFPLIVFDLGTPPIPGGRGIESFWLRLARKLEPLASTLLVASPYRVTGTAAHRVLEAQDRRAVWQGRGESPRWLDGIDGGLRLVKGPGWQEAEPLHLSFSFDRPWEKAALDGPPIKQAEVVPFVRGSRPVAPPRHGPAEIRHFVGPRAGARS